MNVPSDKSQTMLRASKTPLKVKENESGCPEEKEKASFPLSKDQKSCRVTKSKVIRPSKKENFTDGNQARPPKRALKSTKGPEEDLGHSQRVNVSWQLPGGCFGALGGDVPSEPPLPLHSKEDFSSSQPGNHVPLGNDFYSTPERDNVEGKPDFGLSEQRKKPVDFAAVTTAEFGTAQESFTKRPTGEAGVTNDFCPSQRSLSSLFSPTLCQRLQFRAGSGGQSLNMPRSTL